MSWIATCQRSFHSLVSALCDASRTAYGQDMTDPNLVLDDVIAVSIGEQLRDQWCDERDVSDAEWSTLRLVARLRHARVKISFVGGHVVQGTVQDVYRDAVLIASDTLVSLEHLVTVSGSLEDDFPLEVDEPLLSGRSVLRSWAGLSVSAMCVDGQVRAGMLRRVGADHVELKGESGTELLRLGVVALWRRG